MLEKIYLMRLDSPRNDVNSSLSLLFPFPSEVSIEQEENERQKENWEAREKAERKKDSERQQQRRGGEKEEDKQTDACMQTFVLFSQQQR